MSLTAQKKLEILRKVLKEKASISSVCRQEGISRKTFYAWKKKYQAAGPRNKSTCLKKRHLRGLEHPRGRRTRFKNDILRLVVAHPEWGSHTISKVLKRKDKFLGSHGVHTLLKELGLETFDKRKEFAALHRLLTKIQDIYAPGPKRLLSASRKRMVEEVILAGRTVGKVASEFKVSRKTVWKWARRYREAQVQEVALLQALKDQHPEGSLHPRGTPAWLEERILKEVARYPEYSSHRLAKVFEGQIGNHGIQNVLLRNSLNTFEKRKLYAQTQAPTSLIQPVTAWSDRVRLVWEKFIPTLAPAPPPLFREQARKLAKVVFASSATTSIFLLVFLYFLQIISGQPASVKLGLFFAGISLTVGSFFFAYSMKYYLTLALVLSFSRHPGEGLGIGLSGEVRKDGNDHGRKSLLSRIFGLRPGGGPEGLGQEEVRAPGLTPSLDHVKLKRYPFVSIHLPFYNEKKVANRILSACTSFDYPNYEVIVCDDSTDETVKIVKQWEKTFGPSSGRGHPKVKVIHRPTREGFKGGALREAVAHMDPRTEFVLVFDADFVPYPDTIEQFLRYFKASGGWKEDLSYQATKLQSMPYDTFNKVEISTSTSSVLAKQEEDLLKKSPIACVAGYQWHVLNKSENWITRGVRTEYAGSYVIERPGQEILGALKIIHGSVYCVRADILKHFGWGTSITEDFELTLRIYEKGFKVAYTPYIQAPSECVSTIKRLIRQRMRWSEGHSFNVRKMFGRLLFGSFRRSDLKGGPTSPGKVWQPSPLTFTEKLEFLYISPYYLQAFFFLVGTLSWLISETLFPARLPFWTSLWGWSLVLTNFFALPLVNGVGLFLEEAEEKDYLGLISFIFLSYLVVPFQAYASVKGFIEDKEGPWFRTPKTGLITDIFTRGRFYRWISGILPGRRPAVAPSAAMAGKPAFINPYLVLPTANNQFNSFGIKPKRARWLGKLSVVFALVVSLLIGNLVPFVSLGKASIESKKISVISQGEAPVARGLTLLPQKPDFRSDEAPQFTLKIDANEVKKNLFDFGPKRVEAAESEVKTSLYYSGSGGELVDIPSKVEKRKDGNFDIKLLPKESIKPGKYTLRTTVFNDGALYQGSQDFSWGVLALNTHKSIYLPGEEAQLTFGVLDDAGNTICEADLNLQIKSPEGKDTYLSTGEGTIQRSSQCQGNKYSPVPDYTAQFKTEAVGFYTMKLEARVENGLRTVEDRFEVRESLPFEIERTSFPTRIKHSHEYPVRLTIKANQDFQGAVEEKVPTSFEILNSKSEILNGSTSSPSRAKSRDKFKIQNSNNQQIITWEVNWGKGETHELSYTIKFPPVSPQFYLIGPLEFRDNLSTSSGSPRFFEARRWQIASDSPATVFMDTPDATQDTQFWSADLGSVTYDTTPAKKISGLASWKCDSSLNQIARLQKNDILADAGRRISFYLYLDDLPGATTTIFQNWNTGLTTAVFNLRVSSAGVLSIQNNSGNSKTGSTLSVDTLYRISIAYVITSTTVFTIKVFVNGALDITATQVDFTLDAAGGSRMFIGWRDAPGGNYRVLNFSHVYMDDDTSLTDTGDMRVTAKLPATANNNQYVITGGTGAVNERPISETNYKAETGKTAYLQDYTLEAPWAGDVPLGTLGESYTAGDTASAKVYGTQWMAQTFTPTVTHTVSLVRLRVNKYGTIATDLTVAIRATDVDGKPTGSNLTSTSMPAAQIGTIFAWYSFIFASPITLTASVKYAIVVYTSSGDTSNCFQWRVDLTGNYTGGSGASSGNSGVTWSLETGWDYMFEEGELDSTITLVARDAWMWYKTSSTKNPGTQSLVDNGGLVAVAESVTAILVNYITDSASYPSNAAGVGQKSTGTADDIYLYECGTLIAYKVSAFTQSAYRWYANTDTATAGDPYAANNTPYTLTSAGQAFRMRALIHVAGAQLSQNGGSFRLEFAERGTDNLCDTAFANETFAQVTTTSLIKYNNNNTPSDNDATSAKTGQEPDHSGHTIVLQSYQEDNPFTNDEAAIPAGQDGLWDFALADNTGGDNKTYCFRIRLADGSALDSVEVVPEITTVPENPLLLLGLYPILMRILKRLRRRKSSFAKATEDK